MRAFFRRNLYWIVLTGILLGLAVYWCPWRRHGPDAAELFREQRKLMQRPVHVDFEKVQLVDALEALGKEARCAVLVDFSLRSSEFRPGEISMHTAGTMTLEQGITAVLGAAGAPDRTGVWQENGVVMVAPERLILEAPQITVVYDISTLLGDTRGTERQTKVEKIAHLLDGACRYDGTSVIESFNDKLIIRATRYTHTEIAAFLQKLADG